MIPEYIKAGATVYVADGPLWKGEAVIESIRDHGCNGLVDVYYVGKRRGFSTLLLNGEYRAGVMCFRDKAEYDQMQKHGRLMMKAIGILNELDYERLVVAVEHMEANWIKANWIKKS